MQEWFLFVSLSHVLSNICILKVKFFVVFFPSIINIVMHKQRSLRHKPKNTIYNMWYSKMMSRKPSLEIVSRLRSNSYGTSEDVQSVCITPGLQWQAILNEINFCCHKIHARMHIHIYTCSHTIFFLFAHMALSFTLQKTVRQRPKTYRN